MVFLEIALLRIAYRRWNHIEVVNVTLGQFVKLLDREFLSKAAGNHEIGEIIDIVNSGGFFGKKMPSKNGAYELLRSPSAGPLSRVGFQKDSVIIYDKYGNRDFQYKIHLYHRQ